MNFKMDAGRVVLRDGALVTSNLCCYCCNLCQCDYPYFPIWMNGWQDSFTRCTGDCDANNLPNPCPGGGGATVEFYTVAFGGTFYQKVTFPPCEDGGGRGPEFYQYWEASHLGCQNNTDWLYLVTYQAGYPPIGCVAAAWNVFAHKTPEGCPVSLTYGDDQLVPGGFWGPVEPCPFGRATIPIEIGPCPPSEEDPENPLP